MWKNFLIISWPHSQIRPHNHRIYCCVSGNLLSSKAREEPPAQWPTCLSNQSPRCREPTGILLTCCAPSPPAYIPHSPWQRKILRRLYCDRNGDYKPKWSEWLVIGWFYISIKETFYYKAFKRLSFLICSFRVLSHRLYWVCCCWSRKQSNPGLRRVSLERPG